MKTIAVILLGYIGDLVNSSPVCIQLKKEYPNSRLIFITIPAGLETARCLPGVNEVYVYDKKGAHKGLFNLLELTSEIRRKESIDTAIVLDNSLRAAGFACLIGARSKIGRTGEGRSLLLTHKIPHTKEEKDMQIHVSEHYMRVLKPIDLYNPEYDFDFIYSDNDNSYIDQLLQEAGYLNHNLLGLCPCGRYEHKNWTVQEAAKFINNINLTADFKVVIVGSKETEEFTRQLRESGCENFLDLSGKTSISQLGALIGRCNKFVSVDTGPMHLALSLKIPTVALFYHDIAKKWGPKDLIRNRVVYSSDKQGITAEQIYDLLTQI